MGLEQVGAEVRIKGARKAARDADRVARGIDDIGDEARQAGRHLAGMNAAGARLGGGLRSVATGAGYAVAGAAVLTTAFGVRAYKAFDESRRIAALTEAGIRSTGGAANVTADDVARLSQAIAAKTGVDDEMIQSGANMLLTFTRIRNEAGKGNDIFDQAAQITTDLAVRLGKDAPSAALMLGKALNDPVKGATALGRAGVQLTQQQKDQIAAFVESGDMLSAQKIILRELDTQVGGSAEAQATNLDKLRVAWGNIEEAIGSAVAPAVDAISKDLTSLAKGALPEVEAAARRVGGIFSSDELDWVSKLKFSGRAIGQELGPEVQPLVEELQRHLGKIDAGGAISGAIEKGAPVMADALAGQVPNMMRAFVNAFANAGPGGQLLTLALLAKKFGAFGPAGAAAGRLFTTNFRTSATTSGVFNQVGRSGGITLGTGIATHGGNTVKKSSQKGGRLANAMTVAGENSGKIFGTAMALLMVPAIRDALVDAVPWLDRYSGSDGWGNLADDLGFGPTDTGPPSNGAGFSRDERPASPREREERGVPPGAAATTTPPADRRNPLLPEGPAGLPARGAQFGLPGASTGVTLVAGDVNLDGKKVGKHVLRETVKTTKRKVAAR